VKLFAARLGFNALVKYQTAGSIGPAIHGLDRKEFIGRELAVSVYKEAEHARKIEADQREARDL
jgi:hypothetical protein